MKKNASIIERFEGWYVKPINVLKDVNNLPDGDGGYFALSIALSLCERYYRVKTDTQHNNREDIFSHDFMDAAADDFGIKNKDEFSAFWIVYRHGTQHQCMPIVSKFKGITYKWQTRDDFDAIPTFYKIDVSTIEIRINPWKFAELIINKYKSDPAFLEKCFKHAFAAVL